MEKNFIDIIKELSFEIINFNIKEEYFEEFFNNKRSKKLETYRNNCKFLEKSLSYCALMLKVKTINRKM